LKAGRGAGFSLRVVTTGGVAVGLAVVAKAFYSVAGVGELMWILAPSAGLARLAGGIDLVYEPGAGFISHAHHMVVGPACAGVNFMVICFLALYFSFAARCGGRIRWLASAIGLAFASAIIANALRIVVSSHLWNADFYLGWMTREEMHRLAGVLIYFGSLLALWMAVDSAVRAGERRANRAAPLLWYVGVSLGVPLFGRFYSADTTGYGEHAVWVLGIATAATLLMFLPSMVRNRVF
jgi:exosortase K